MWCPQCKAPFTNLLTYRKLDGTLSDFPVEESVCLLKRAHWFEAHMKVQFYPLASAFCSKLASRALLNKYLHSKSLCRHERQYEPYD